MSTFTNRHRWIVVVLLFFATTINYLDRQVIGLLKPVLEKEFNWSESDYANIVMAFSATYAIGLLGFGKWIDKIGTRLGYFISVLFWSIAAMLHAVAKTTLGFGIARAGLGLAESGNFPAAIKAIAEWFPKKERAFATGIFNSGANLGAMIAPVMVPLILAAYGWKEAFLITGAIGFVWLFFWWRLYRVPSKHASISAKELAHINSDGDIAEEHEQPINWLSLFKIKQTWAFIFGKLFTDPIWWFYLFWLPSYFSTVYKIDLKKPSLPLVIIYTATTVGSVFGGFLSSWLIKKGWTINKARKTSMLFFALAVVPIMAARYATNIWQVIGLISLAAAAHQAWSANVYTTVSDVFPKKAVSSVIGIGGMAGSAGGIFFPLFIGWVLDRYKLAGDINVGYNLIFSVCGCSYLLAWVLMYIFSPKAEKVIMN